MVGPRCLPARDAARLLGGGTVKLTGAAAEALAQEARIVGASISVIPSGPSADIAWVARLGAMADPHYALPRPTYLKPVDATPQTSGRVRRA